MKHHPLTTYRTERGLIMKDAAKALKISQATISRIEAGKQTPEPELMRRIYKWTRGTVTPNDLLGL